MNGSSNCYGYVLMNGEYILAPENMNEQTILNFGYERCLKAEASVVVVYNGGEISHAGKYDRLTDTYSAKGGTADYYIRTDMYLYDFYRPYDNDSNPYNDVNYGQGDITTVYYRLKGSTGYGIGY